MSFGSRNQNITQNRLILGRIYFKIHKFGIISLRDRQWFLMEVFCQYLLEKVVKKCLVVQIFFFNEKWVNQKNETAVLGQIFKGLKATVSGLDYWHVRVLKKIIRVNEDFLGVIKSIQTAQNSPICWRQS